jgi:two-component system, LuxR family, sensor kinase FixL
VAESPTDPAEGATGREAEERLRRSEEMHRLTLELTQQIVWTTEADGSGLIMSERYRELTGIEDAADAAVSIHPDERDTVLEHWGAALQSGKPFDVECRLRTKDGVYRFFHIRGVPRRDALGRIQRWYGITADVDDQKQAELARLDMQERYRLAAQATNDAIWDHDFSSATIEWGDNSSAILGVALPPHGRMPASWWEERIHPDEKLSLLQSLSDAIGGSSRRWSGTYRFRRDDGSYADVLDRGFIIRDAKGRAIRAVGAMSDVTERHRAEAEIRRMQAELIHVSRLSAMGAMASTLAHELNQPLAAVTNFVSGAKRIAENSDSSREVLTEALEGAEIAARRAGEILRRVRDLVSRGKVSVRTEHLPQLIDEACVLAFIDAEVRGIPHRLELDPAAQWVRADRIQIQQVLINLVRNAVEAIGNRARREIVIATRPSGKAVEIEVADTGSGIAVDNPDDLFSEFLTTKSGGMGIGLPISRTIVEAHGGQIWAENRPGGGAVFRFTVPRARPRAGKKPRP